MEMNQIRYFLALCEHHNFTHAAQASNVSQPSLTAAIKKLEDELGGPLFLRDRAGCRLTPLGSLLRPRLEKVQQETQEAKMEAIRHIRLERVPISIGVGETIGHGKISEAVERYRLRHPKAEIELIVDSQHALLNELRDGRFDIVITSAKVSSELYRIDLLYSEHYRVVVAAEHHLAQHKSVSLDDLANTNMLDRPNCEMRETLHEACANGGIELYASYRSNRIDWLLELARLGTGAVILPATSIPTENALVALPIDELKIERKILSLRYRQQPTRSETNELVRELTLA